MHRQTRTQSTNPSTSQSEEIFRNEIMSLYDNDPSLPYWRNNICVEQLLEDFESNGKMPGHFEMAILPDHTFSWTFTPRRDCELVTVIPVYDKLRLVDILAVTDNPRVWGAVTGFGSYVGEFNNDVLHVHDTPASWLAAGEGVLPLSRSFFPLLQFAGRIVTRNEEHAEKIANETFIYHAEKFGFDCFEAERAANERISF